MKFGKTEILELASAAAVVISLIFVGLELRQANVLAEAESVWNINSLMNDVLVTQVESPELNELFVKEKSEELSAAEAMRVGSWAIMWLNVYETQWKFHDKGIVSDEDFEGYSAAACWEIANVTAIRDTWRVLGESYSLGFQQFVAEECPKHVDTLDGTRREGVE